MVVRCTRIKMESSQSEIINNDISKFAQEGATFGVYGITISSNITYYIIYSDGHLVEVPKDLFSIIDHSIPPLWEVRINEFGELTFWPELFSEESFFENFSDWKEKERKQFEELKSSFKFDKDA